MPSRRQQITMSPEEVDAFLAATRTLNVATIGPTGHPHLVAMWYGFLDGQVAFWTFAKSQKILNLRRDPKLSALAEEGTTYEQLKGVGVFIGLLLRTVCSINTFAIATRIEALAEMFRQRYGCIVPGREHQPVQQLANGHLFARVQRRCRTRGLVGAL